jgi:hypothetical protein
VVIAFALLALLAAAAGAAVPAFRHAIGDLFRGSGATVERVPSLPPLGGELDLGRAVPADDATGQAGFRVLLPRGAELGAPDAVHVRAHPPVAQVTLVYRPRRGLPETGTEGVGALLTEFRGDLEPALLEKLVGSGVPIRRVRVHGRPALFIAGPHSIAYRDARGRIRSEDRRLSGRTLLWRQGRLLLRLESGLELRRATAVARATR